MKTIRDLLMHQSGISMLVTEHHMQHLMKQKGHMMRLIMQILALLHQLTQQPSIRFLMMLMNKLLDLQKKMKDVNVRKQLHMLMNMVKNKLTVLKKQIVILSQKKTNLNEEEKNYQITDLSSQNNLLNVIVYMNKKGVILYE